jgi:hypothetical protein
MEATASGGSVAGITTRRLESTRVVVNRVLSEGVLLADGMVGSSLDRPPFLHAWRDLCLTDVRGRLREKLMA